LGLGGGLWLGLRPAASRQQDGGDDQTYQEALEKGFMGHFQSPVDLLSIKSSPYIDF
jgi:hypothetical protein